MVEVEFTPFISEVKIRLYLDVLNHIQPSEKDNIFYSSIPNGSKFEYCDTYV